MSLDNLTEQPAITAPDEPALPASTDQPGIATPTAIATSPAEPDGDDVTSHDDPSPLAGRPCADQCSPVDSDDTAPDRCRTPASTHTRPAARSTRPTRASEDAEPSADIEDAERSADAGVAHRVLVIGVAAILVVVALVGRRRRGRAGVSP